MKHTYQIHGMTCNGCRNHVENALNNVEDVTKAAVDLQRAEAVIEMESHIPLEKLQNALKSSSYSISLPGHGTQEHVHDSHAQHSKHLAAETKPKQTCKAAGVYYFPMHCEVL